MRRIDEAQLPDDDGSPVAALRAVPCVAETRHQLRDDLGVSSGAVPWLPRLAGKSIAWQRQRDDVKGGVVGLSAMGRGIRERSDDFGDLEERPRPAMDEHERNGVGPARSLVDEVNIHAVDRRLELRQLIEA